MTDAVTGTDPATEERLLDATEQLVQRIGIEKTSMSDVARAAGVSRATLYRYFDSRDALLTTLSHRSADRFFADVALAMDERATLSEQVGQFCEIMIRELHPGSDTQRHSQVSLARMLATESPQALLRTSRFLRGYLENARDRGEVDTGLDVADASEWLARVLLSFTIFQSSISYEAGDPESVSRFVQRYAISGLIGIHSP